ncbi:hypothetical protein SLA2020_248470 [Shorea laevis]
MNHSQNDGLEDVVDDYYDVTDFEHDDPFGEREPQSDNDNFDSLDSDFEDDFESKKETPATTAVLKLQLHCEDCIEKIQKTVAKTKGVQDMSMDEQKDLLTVKGTMDMKASTEVLKERLKDLSRLTLMSITLSTLTL